MKFLFVQRIVAPQTVIFPVYLSQMNTDTTEIDNMTFGKKLRQLRIKHNMSQKELGLLVHVTAQAVSKWEHDLSEPEFRVVKEIADFFQISVDQLFSSKLSAPYTGVLFTGKRSVKMRRLYDILTLFLSGLLVSLLILTVFTYQAGQLTWHFPTGFGAATIINLIALWYIAGARFEFLANPDTLLEVYYDRIVLLGRATIPINDQLNFQVAAYRAMTGIGAIKIRVSHGRWSTVRNIEHINELGALLSQLYFDRNSEEEK